MRALIVENETKWQGLIASALKQIEGLEVDIAAAADAALMLASTRSYSIITVDISLIGAVDSKGTVDKAGLDFLARLRRQRSGTDAAIVIVSGYATGGAVNEGYRKYGILDLIDKAEFDPATVAKCARHAIVSARIAAAERRLHARHEFELSLNASSLVGSQLHGPMRSGDYPLNTPVLIDTAKLARFSDKLNLHLLRDEVAKWRALAQKIGSALYNLLAQQPEIAEPMLHARDLSVRTVPSVLSFVGPASGLGIPFELLAASKDYLCLQHIIARRLTGAGGTTKKPQPFHRFIEDLVQRDEEPLRALLVASNSDGFIPAVEEETNEVAAEIGSACKALGIPLILETVHTKDATYEDLAALLAQNEYHVFHYAGHGEHHEKAPERSGIVLGNGTSFRTLTASDLKNLFSDTTIRLVYLSCCLSARTAQRVGQGDFHGALEAVVRADVPIAIGQRWVIPDQEASNFAVTFYEQLFALLSPGIALLGARRAASQSISGGRDNPLWASPVLVCHAPP